MVNKETRSINTIIQKLMLALTKAIKQRQATGIRVIYMKKIAKKKNSGLFV